MAEPISKIFAEFGEDASQAVNNNNNHSIKSVTPPTLNQKDQQAN